jgi:putative CocE/NonD family hydrolase
MATVTGEEHSRSGERIGGVLVNRDIPAQMSDGTVLFSDIYRPGGEGLFPVLLIRQPYDKTHAETFVYHHPSWYARHGYIVVSQDVRGRWKSEGEFYPFRYEMQDGYDTVEWAAALDGSNGMVGMYGFSYGGLTQLFAAGARPPHLACICPALTASQCYEGWTYRSGALSLAFVVSWALYLARDTARRRGLHDLEQELHEALAHAQDQFSLLPLTRNALLIRENIAPYFFDWIRHPEYDDYWKSWSIDRMFEQISVPALHIAGWYDIFLSGNVNNYAGITAYGAGKTAREGQKLLIGPWFHSPWSPLAGPVDFGKEGRNRVNELQLRWFDYWLKDVPNGIMDEPRVSFFLTGKNRWEDTGSWPPAGCRQECLFLHSTGTANSLFGSGTLDRCVPGEEPEDVFVYDPADAVMSLGGHSCCLIGITPMGPADQRPIEILNQVLVYTTGRLTEELQVSGQVNGVLWASSSAVDTDFTMKLVDVHPDGKALNLAEGILRCRYRGSQGQGVLLEPGNVYRFEIGIGQIGHIFLAGHRIRLEVSSSNFPQFDRQTNSGNVPAQDGFGQIRVATQQVWHNRARPSHLILPVVPAGKRG